MEYVLGIEYKAHLEKKKSFMPLPRLKVNALKSNKNPNDLKSLFAVETAVWTAGRNQSGINSICCNGFSVGMRLACKPYAYKQAAFLRKPCPNLNPQTLGEFRSDTCCSVARDSTSV